MPRDHHRARRGRSRGQRRGRGRGRGTADATQGDSQGGDVRYFGGHRGHGGGDRHPPGLKGKDIGMFYKNRSVGKRRRRELEQRSLVELDSQQVSDISRLLNEVKTEVDRDGSSSSGGPSKPLRAQRRIDAKSRTFYTTHLERKESLDVFLSDEAERRKLKAGSNKRYLDMQAFREKLPAYKMQKELMDLINSNQVVVVSGETGCGKTTQVPQFILDDHISRGQGSLCRVVCTQPRRISAISVAERVADERGEPCGQEGSVGYQIRLEHKFPRVQGSILYCTTGILLKWLESDSLLHSISHVVLDEIHERDILSDFLLIIIRDILTKRKDLKLVLMSATLNAVMFSEYFSNSPMINIPGFTFPVTEFWLEDILGMIKCRPQQQSNSGRRGEPVWKKYARAKKKDVLREDEVLKAEEFEKRLDGYISSMKGSYPDDVVDFLAQMDHDIFDVNFGAELVKHICLNKPEGAILVFMPGWDKISKMNDIFMKDTMFRSSKFRIIPLHSLMPSVEQKQVFVRPPPGVRKIIIATNIAETSITIEDVVYVIDMGRTKMSNFDLERNLNTLKAEWISKASAHQRRGRAGRVQPGECYHVYSQLKADLMEEYLLPEMLRTPLESICLRIKTLNLGQIEPFICKALQPADMKAISLAIETLHQLRALDDNEDLTPLGYHLSLLPVNPRIGKIILFGAMFCCLDPVLTIAASLDFKDPFIIPLGKEEMADRKRRELSQDTRSDHIMLVNAFSKWEESRVNRITEEEFCWDNFMSKNTLKMIDNMKGQFCELLCDIGFVESRSCKHKDVNINSDNHALIKAFLCAGLYPNIAKVNPYGGKKNPKITTYQDGRVEIHLKSVNAKWPSFTSRWLMYHTKIKSSSVFLHDTSQIDHFPLLFFGGRIWTMESHGFHHICVDEDIKFHAPVETAKLVMELRTELDELLEGKIGRPGPTDWSSGSREGRIMKTIADLLTSGEGPAPVINIPLSAQIPSDTPSDDPTPEDPTPDPEPPEMSRGQVPYGEQFHDITKLENPLLPRHGGTDKERGNWQGRRKPTEGSRTQQDPPRNPGGYRIQNIHNRDGPGGSHGSVSKDCIPERTPCRADDRYTTQGVRNLNRPLERRGKEQRYRQEVPHHVDRYDRSHAADIGGEAGQNHSTSSNHEERPEITDYNHGHTNRNGYGRYSTSVEHSNESVSDDGTDPSVTLDYDHGGGIPSVVDRNTTQGLLDQSRPLEQGSGNYLREVPHRRYDSLDPSTGRGGRGRETSTSCKPGARPRTADFRSGRQNVSVSGNRRQSQRDAGRDDNFGYDEFYDWNSHIGK